MKKLLLLSIIFTSCSVLNFMPAYDSSVVLEIKSTQEYADSLATVMIDNVDKNFATYQTGYEVLDLKVKNIYALELQRANGKLLAKQAESMNSVFQNWYSYHAKSITLTSDEAGRFKDLFDASINSLLVSENSLKSK